MEAVLERNKAFLENGVYDEEAWPPAGQPEVKQPLTRLLDLLAGWERYADGNQRDGFLDAADICERIGALYQEAGNLDTPPRDDDTEALLRTFLTDRVLPVLLYQK